MKRSVLGQSAYGFGKQINRRIFLCAVIAFATIALNFLLTSLRTDANHAIMLVANILSDIFCGCFLLYFIQLHILPKRKLYKLSTRPKTQLSGNVLRISAQPQRYLDMDCYAVTVDGRTVFLPVGTLELKLQPYTFFLVSNVIVEVEQ